MACLDALVDSPEVRAEEARCLVRLGRARAAVGVAVGAVVSAEAAVKATPEGERVLAEAVAAAAEAQLAAGALPEAHAAALRAVELTEDVFGALSVEAALSLDALSLVLQHRGDAPAALAPATRALVILEQREAGAYDRAQVHQTLAEAWHRAGRYSEARGEWDRCLALRRGALDAGHPEIAAALDGLGLTLRRLGRAREAVAAHQEALALHEAWLGAWHPAVAACCHGLAQALHRQGDFPGARVQAARALAVSERVQGKDHPDTELSRFELGRMEVDCGELDGFARMEEARRALRDRLGPEHPAVVAMGRWL